MREVAEVASELRGFEGIGPFYAELVTVRALGHTDVLPTTEPRVIAATAARLDRESLSPADFAEVAEAWRPWRTWAVRRPPRRRLIPPGCHLTTERARQADDLTTGRQARSAARLIARASDPMISARPPKCPGTTSTEAAASGWA